jgi:hypothetical protein
MTPDIRAFIRRFLVRRKAWSPVHPAKLFACALTPAAPVFTDTSPAQNASSQTCDAPPLNRPSSLTSL